MRIQVENKIFENEDIYLDGHSWFQCEFKKCNIILERGDFDLSFCKFDGCKLTVRGQAASILKVVKLFFPQMPVF